LIPIGATVYTCENCRSFHGTFEAVEAHEESCDGAWRLSEDVEDVC
jgi:hypothetical protein